MKVAIAVLVAALSFTGARCARQLATKHKPEGLREAPYTPSPASAPFVSLGYREAFADMLYVRLREYFGDYHETTADGIASLAEAIVALDPKFHRVYDYAANATTMAASGVDQSALLRSVALLERGLAEFPKDWELPLLAGQIYIQDLKTTDQAQRHAWDERGVLLVESSIRKPGAPQKAAVWASHIRTKLGQHDRAVQGLRELLLVTNQPALRAQLLDRLAKLEEADSAEIASEVFSERAQFEQKWRAERPSVNASMYIQIGPRIQPGFEMTDLATGGRDLIGSEVSERLEPVE